MYIPETYLQAVILCFVTMFCWGSWANTQKLANKSWRFELFYWDFALGIFIFSVLSAFTLGSYGQEGRGFLTDVFLADKRNLLLAISGGVVFNLANILFVTAINLLGMAVAFPVSIGIALVLGVFLNYLVMPVGNVFLLFLGVASVVFAILLTAAAHKKNASVGESKPYNRLSVAISAGVLMGGFYWFVASSMMKDFNHPEIGKLSPYSAVFFMALGVLLSNLFFNTTLMKRPLQGLPLSYNDYLKGSLRDHLSGIAGGMVWCLGISLSIIASGKAGYAISYGLGQGATLIAAIWGVFVWKEFKNAPKGTDLLIRLMFVFYVLGLTIIIFSR